MPQEDFGVASLRRQEARADHDLGGGAVQAGPLEGRRSRARQPRARDVEGPIQSLPRSGTLRKGDNPVEGVDFLPEPWTRLRYREPEEEAGLLEAAREPLRSVILIGIHAGLRNQAEALLLAWSDVDLKRGLLTVQAAYAKNGTNRTVPLNSALRDALARLKETAKGSERVFTSPRSGKPLRSIRNAFELVRQKAGIGEDVTPHTLRHTFASRLAMAGVDPRTIQELGGWKTLALVERYSHLSPRHRAEAVERIVKIPQPFSQHPDVAPGAATA